MHYTILCCSSWYDVVSNRRKKHFLQWTYQEVYVEQPPGFESSIYPHHVFKLNKALYGLKQAPQDWYEKLSSFLIENGFIRGKVDTTLFHKDYGSQFLIIQIYMDDIIFRTTNDSLLVG